jgi:transposase
MFEALGITEVIDRATKQEPAMRLVTAGHAVKAMVLNGLGFVYPQLYLVPHVFQNKPRSRRIAPALEARQLHDDTRGRALETLYAYGVTALYRLLAAPAATRLGLAPTCTHLDSTSCHVDGRYHSAETPDDHGVHLTRGSSREHRPDLHQVMLAVIVEHHAGIPVLMQPLRGHSSDAKTCGQVVRDHLTPLHTTSGTTYLVAARALETADNLSKLAETRLQWIPRVPATLPAAKAVLAQAQPETRAVLSEGSRYAVLASGYGGVAQRWVLLSSAHRQPQAQRTVDTQLRQHGDRAGKACQQLCRTAFACEAEAQQARAHFAAGWQATSLQARAVHPMPRDGQRGRPGPRTQPDQVVYPMDGALASPVAPRPARVDQHSCCILAPNELDEGLWPGAEVLNGAKGPTRAERGLRFRKAPQFFAASL